MSTLPRVLSSQFFTRITDYNWKHLHYNRVKIKKWQSADGIIVTLQYIYSSYLNRQCSVAKLCDCFWITGHGPSTLSNKVFSELIVTQLLKKFSTFYGTWRSITAFKWSHHHSISYFWSMRIPIVSNIFSSF
jgi:hypothetical protein